LKVNLSSTQRRTKCSKFNSNN